MTVKQLIIWVDLAACYPEHYSIAGLLNKTKPNGDISQQEYEIAGYLLAKEKELVNFWNR